MNITDRARLALKHYGNPEYELTEEESAEMESIDDMKEMMDEMADDDRRG